MKKNLFLIFFLISNITFSQDNLSKCLSTKLINDETTISPSYLDILNSPKKIKNHQNKTIIEIPIVIHIIHLEIHIAILVLVQIFQMNKLKTK